MTPPTPSNHRPKLELLAPAGDDECLRAAVANGANAVYFGLEDFNARRRARNFTLAGLAETMRWLHRHNVKGYVAFNTLVFTQELPRAADFVRAIIAAGGDAIIVQDLGLAALIRRMSPQFPIHASTQMTQTHAAGLALLREMGVSRSILARELSLAEIQEAAAAEVMELEVFVHGALCVSYSGQCLASELLWGRSGNRGVCAQACRLPYELIVDGKVVPQQRGAYLLSPYDLATYDRVGELIRAGVTSFKIEGRLKNAEYVALTTRLYRQAIDAAVRGQPFSLSTDQQADLAQSFSRGFTQGFLDGDRHTELIGAQSPRNRGLLIGTVVRRTSNSVIVRSAGGACSPLKPGDGVVFGGDDEEATQGGRVYSAIKLPSRDGRTPSEYELKFGRDDLNVRRIAVGSDVFKTDDPATRRRIESTYARDRIVHTVPIRAGVRAVAGERMMLSVTDDDGHKVRVWSEDALSIAERRPVTLEVIREQLSRLGDTPFELTDVTLTGMDGQADALPVMVPKSVLNDLRRRAVRELEETRERASACVVTDGDALNVLRLRTEGCHINVSTDQADARTVTDRPICLHVLTRHWEQFAATCESASRPVGNVRVSTVYVEFTDRTDDAKAADVARRYGLNFGLTTTQVLKPGEEKLLDGLMKMRPDVLLVRNLTALGYLRQGYTLPAWVADSALNTTNDVTALALAQHAAVRITPGYDLNVEQLAALMSQAHDIEFELIAHAHVPMFHMAHCLAAASVSKRNSCEECGRPCRRHVLQLRDRNGERHPVGVDVAGRTTIFSNRVQSVAACRNRRNLSEVRHWRVELLDEDGPTTRELLTLYQRMFNHDPAAAKELRRMMPDMRPGTLEHV